ncbi:MAG: hypothetical protein PF484_07775 [Bacteroidales bacterium]|jgi:hypothetical protein|nr:hypothetical protein [Bacteroidales bacterium]
MRLFKTKEEKEKGKPFEWGSVILVGFIAIIVIYKCLQIIISGFE